MAVLINTVFCFFVYLLFMCCNYSFLELAGEGERGTLLQCELAGTEFK